MHELTEEHATRISERWEAERLKGGVFKLLAQVIQGELLIGVYRPDEVGLNNDLLMYVDLLMHLNGNVRLEFDDNGKPVVTSSESGDPIQWNTPEVAAQMEASVEKYIRQYFEEYPDLTLSEERIEEAVARLTFSIGFAQGAGLTSINWKVTREQILYILQKMTSGKSKPS